MQLFGYVKGNFMGGVQGAYQSPSVELIEVKTEKGFADSFTKEEEEF